MRTLSKEEVEAMIARGYRRTSNRFGLVSRIDRPDWKEFSKENRFPVNADWYRRCVSKDTLELGASTGKRFPTSVHDETGYLE